MGYQEMIVRYVTDDDESKLYSKCEMLFIFNLIEPLGYFKSKVNYKGIKAGEIYCIYATERHPGADELCRYFKNDCYAIEDFLEMCSVTGDENIFEDEYKEYISSDLIENEQYKISKWNEIFYKLLRNRRIKMSKLLTTIGVNDLISNNKKFAKGVANSLQRFDIGDWGDLCDDDKQLNDSALICNDRIVARYNIEPRSIYIIMEWDRSVTTVLFPEEY